MLYKFERYLQSLGYEPFVIERYREHGENKIKFVPVADPENHMLSTMINTDRCWVKDDDKIWHGLSERDKPPTITSNRPIMQFKKDGVEMDPLRDDTMNIALQYFSCEQIYTAMKTREPLVLELNTEL